MIYELFTMDPYWKKVENEAGYPLFIDDTGKQQFDHPKYADMMSLVEEYDGIKYSAYRTAYKIFALRSQLTVPPLRISSGVFARHQLSLSESSLLLDTSQLEDVLADIYFAAEKEGCFNGDVDLIVDLLINLLLNVYDKDRKEPIRVLAAKTLLILLSEESITDKWAALANCCSDHNGCVSPKRLASLLTHVTVLSQFLGCNNDYVQEDVENCFAKSAGMLGLSSRTVAEWGVSSCKSTRFLNTVQRVVTSRLCTEPGFTCACCTTPMVQVLRFQCTKCSDIYFCEKCYLYDKDLTSVSGHKKNHVIHEIIDGQPKPPQCLSFMKGMKRFFFCTKTKKRKTYKMKPDKEIGYRRVKSKPSQSHKPVIFTSTVGKASGNKGDNPSVMLQDIINQLEAQNKAIQDLANEDKGNDETLKAKVNSHYSQISTQINRLKLLKDNLTNQPDKNTKETERPQAFELFSPIPVEDKPTKSKSDNVKNPRVLSLDSGNFSAPSKSGSREMLTVTADALKPSSKTQTVQMTTDSISAVSVNDITTWYNDQESEAPHKRVNKPADITECEAKYAADIRSVETSNDKVRDLNADLDNVLDRLHEILAHNFAMDDSCFDNTQLRETANEMEGLIGTLIRGVEQRATLNATKGLV